MPDINLLQNQLEADTQFKYKRLFSRISKVLLILNILILIAGVGLWIWNASARPDSGSTSNVVAEKRTELALEASNKRDEVVKTQAQIKHTNQLLEGHLYWTNLFEVISEASISDVQFIDFRANSDGSLSITALASDLTIMAAFTQKLNSLESIKKATINSSSLSNRSGQSFYNFIVDIEFVPEVLKFNSEDEVSFK